MNTITRIKGLEIARAKKSKKIEEYNKNPKFCLACKKQFSYEQSIEQTRKYCSHTCAALTSNKNRNWKHTEESKAKTSLASIRAHQLRKLAGKKYVRRCGQSKIQYRNCMQCNNLFTVRGHTPNAGRKTCSDHCYQELRSSVTSKKFQQLKVHDSEGRLCTLQSSWEIDIFNLLVEGNIHWTRPKAVIWINSLGKRRKYYSDFYLTDYNLYLDPKNSTLCRTFDKEKMEAVSKTINVIWGELDLLKKIVLELGESTSLSSLVPQTSASI